MNSFLEILTLVMFAITIVVAPIAWLRIVKAKTRTAYWKNVVLFAGPILLVFFLANSAGLVPEISAPPPTPPQAQDVFDAMPRSQLLLLIAAGGSLDRRR